MVVVTKKCHHHHVYLRGYRSIRRKDKNTAHNYLSGKEFKVVQYFIVVINTYLYCETAIGCRFFQAEVVEFSDEK